MCSVTGAQGFIGSWVAERLLDEGAQVLVLDRPPAAALALLLRGLHERCTAVAADLLDHGLAAAPRSRITGCRPCSTSRRPRSWVGEDLPAEHLRGQRPRHLEPARGLPSSPSEPPARIVVASTDKAYGVHENLPYREDHALQPRYPYDASKAGADIIARSYAHTFGLPVAVTRFGNVFGGGDFNFSRLIPGTIRALLGGRAAGDPLQRADGARLPLRRGRGHGLPGGGRLARSSRSCAVAPGTRASGGPVSVLEVVTRLVEISGLERRARRAWATALRTASSSVSGWTVSAISEQLGWTPEWDLRRGLRATFEWYAAELPRLDPLPARAG